MRTHVATFVQPYLSEILSGEKTIDARFSVKKVAPFRKIAVGDKVFIKGVIVRGYSQIQGEVSVKNVEFYERLTPSKVRVIFDQHPQLLAREDFVKAKLNSSYGTLWWMGNVKKYDFPPMFVGNARTGWIVKSDGIRIEKLVK